VISICVIGRNEGLRLRDCGQSLRVFATLDHPFETIYVDSCSGDDSVAIARTHFDRVIELRSDPHLNASAGRYVATCAARGDWIVYLDGDMTLRPEFVPVIGALLESREPLAGVVGNCRHVYPDGLTRPMTIRGNLDGRPCKAFGGAVVLAREHVLDAGNWNPRLYSNEEVELYGRLRKAGSRVIYRDVPFVDHHTDRISKGRMLLGSIWPVRSVLGKKFYGLGQVVVAGLRGGTLLTFLRAKPEPFVFLAGIIMALSLALIGYGGAAATAALIAVLLAIKAAGTAGPIVYLTWLPQIALGLFHFPRRFMPEIAREWRAAESPRDDR
jgi:glycosyltransferase involved in cell wall biosynthesis